MENQEIPDMNLWQRLTGIISKPAATLAAVAEKPAVLWPAVVISLTNIVLFVITIPKLQQFFLWQYENIPKQGIPAEQLAKMKILATGNAAVAVTGATVVLMPFVIWLVMTLAFKFLNLFTGEEAPFKKLYAVAVISSVPVIIGTALRNILVIFSKGEDYLTVTTSAALALPKGSTGPLFALLSSIDPFIIWTLALAALGAAQVLKTSVKKTGIVVFVLWVLQAAVTVITTMKQATPV